MLTTLSRRFAALLALAMLSAIVTGSALAQDHGSPQNEAGQSLSGAESDSHEQDHADANAGSDHAGAEHGAEHDVHGVIGTVKQGLVTGITAIVVFLIVLAILSKAVWPKIQAGLDEREKKIRDEIESAEEARQQAKDALEMYEKSLAQARAEAQQMLEDAKVEQQKFSNELRAKAEAEQAARNEKAQREIESAKRAAVNEVYAEAATLATSIASKILSREVSSDDQMQLIEEAVAELGSASHS